MKAFSKISPSGTIAPSVSGLWITTLGCSGVTQFNFGLNVKLSDFWLRACTHTWHFETSKLHCIMHSGERWCLQRNAIKKGKLTTSNTLHLDHYPNIIQRVGQATRRLEACLSCQSLSLCLHLCPAVMPQVCHLYTLAKSAWKSWKR